jgi:hypothetical protein
VRSAQIKQAVIILELLVSLPPLTRLPRALRAPNGDSRLVYLDASKITQIARLLLDANYLHRRRFLLPSLHMVSISLLGE